MEKINIKELEIQKRELESQIQKYYDQKYHENILRNEQFIGKTYKQQNEDDSYSYYKIISCINDNVYRMNTLIFTFPFNIETHFDGLIDCELCTFDDVGWFCTDYRGKGKREIDFYIEITEEEFSTKLNEWFDFLKGKI